MRTVPTLFAIACTHGMVGRCQSVIAELNVGQIATELLNYGKGIAIRYRLVPSVACQTTEGEYLSY